MLQKTQDLQEQLIKRTTVWFHKKIGWRFFIGLQLFSFIIYAVVSLSIEFFVYHRDVTYLLYTPYVPFYLNPLHVLILSLLYLILYFVVLYEKKVKAYGDNNPK